MRRMRDLTSDLLGETSFCRNVYRPSDAFTAWRMLPCKTKLHPETPFPTSRLHNPRQSTRASTKVSNRSYLRSKGCREYSLN